MVFEQPELTILSGHVEGKIINELHSHLQVEIKSANDPSKIESVFPLPLSTFFQVKGLPRGKHLLQLRFTLPSSNHIFESEVCEADSIASIKILGQIMLGIGLENLRTNKKMPRRRKKERGIKQTEKASIE